MERNLLIFIALLAACAAGAILGAVEAKFGPAAAFTLFCIVGNLTMVATAPDLGTSDDWPPYGENPSTKENRP